MTTHSRRSTNRGHGGARVSVWATTVCLVGLILAAAPTPARATTYYVSNGGSDDAGGKSPATSWRSVNRANGGPLRPGDVVRFKRGDCWREQLIPHSGDETGHVTYSAYGSGPKPLLLGSVEMNDPADWKHEGGNVWTTVQPTPSGPERLANPSLTADATRWNLYYEHGGEARGARDTAEYDSAPAAYRVRCVKPGKAGSNIQLYTGPFRVERGKLYRLTFRAKCTKPFRLFPPRIMKSGPPWTSYAPARHLRHAGITETWATCSYLYTAGVTADDARLAFFFGGMLPEAATFWLDSLSLADCATRKALVRDVGNIIFDGEASCGVKVFERSKLKSQGQYWYDEDRCVLKLYSTECPTSRYTDIECAIRNHIVDQGGASYVIYENLALKYGAAHGFGGGNTHHIIVRDCDLGYIGGGDQRGGSGTVRFGNGVEFWANAHDNLVERCRLWEIYDAALTHQSNGPRTKQYNITYRNNVIWNCEYSFEYWNRPEDSETHHIVFDNNTCINAGHGWGHTQRPDPSGRHLCFYTSPAQIRDFFIRNNVFHEAKRNAFYAPTWTREQIAALVMDHNCWFQAEGNMILLPKKQGYPMSRFGAYQADHHKEPHSLTARPGLLDAAKGDFRLAEGSPCIDAGVDVGIKADFAGTPAPQGKAPDIGAFERRR